MDQQPNQFVTVPLDAGIDVSVDEHGQPKGVRSMINLAYDAEGAVKPRGPIQRLASSASVNVAPGPLLPTSTVPVHSRASTVPLEVECIARAATTARLYAAQAATVFDTTLLVTTCRDESAVAEPADDPDNYLDFAVYDDSGNVLTTQRVDPATPLADVKITQAVSTGGDRRFLLTYVVPQTRQLFSSIVTYTPATNSLVVGSTTVLFSTLDQNNWATSIHAVEFDGTGLGLLVFTVDSGTLRYVPVDGITGVPGVVVNTTLAITAYTEMASCHADGIITVVCGYQANAQQFGVYSFNDTTLSVSTHSYTYSAASLSRRLAVVPDDTSGSGNAIVFVELDTGTDAHLASATLGIIATTGEIQTVRLADAGTWIDEDNLTGNVGQHRVPLIGFTSSEFYLTNFRQHVVARVYLDGAGVPRFSVAAILAHSDAGVTYGRIDFTPPHTRVGSLPRYAFPGGPTVRLPVLVVTRTTADVTIDASGTSDVFDRAVRLTTIASNAHQHRGVVSLGPNTYLGGAVPSSWDGSSLSPAGFPLPPHTAKVTSFTTAGGLPAGTYGYQVRQHYQDAQGTIFDSPITYLGFANRDLRTIVTGDTPKVTLYPGALWMNMFDSQQRARFGTEVFRNPSPQEGGDSTFRKAFTISHSAVEASTFVNDRKSATDIAKGELLPDPLNGEITSGPLPALRHIWSHRSRIFGIDAFDTELVRFTTEYAAPTAPRWNDALTTRVSNSGKACIGGASLVDKCVVFQEHQIAVMSGEGPDGTGNGSFSLPESLRGVGAMPGTQGAIVEVPTGVMFVHATGIYHLGFDLALSFVGQKLTRKVGGLPPIKRGVYLPTRKEVWFLTDGSTVAELGTLSVLVWDLTRSRWTAVSSSLGPFSDAIEAQSDVYLLDTRGRLLKAPGAGVGAVDRDEANAAVPYSMTVKLPKLRIDVGHNMRLRKVHVGGSKSNAALTLTTDVESYNESNSGGPRTDRYAMNLSGYGESFQVPLRALTQRCTTAQCTLTMTVDNASLANTFTLASLEYELSVLPGTGKVAADKRPTVSVV